jgi:hypothetical protein
MNVLSPTLTVIDLMAVAASAQQPIQKILFDRKSAAYALSISVRSLDYLIANKRLTFRKIGKKVLIPAVELRKFARADHAELTGDSL